MVSVFLVVVISISLHFCMQFSSCCIDALILSSLLANPFPLSLFLTHIVCQRNLLDVMPYAWSLVFLFSCPVVEFFTGLLEVWSRVYFMRFLLCTLGSKQSCKIL